MPDDLHDRFNVHASIREVRDCTVPKVMEHKTSRCSDPYIVAAPSDKYDLRMLEDQAHTEARSLLDALGE